MISPRPTNGVNAGIGVSYRVSACRRRLRVSRWKNRANAQMQEQEEFREIDSPAKPRRDNPGVVLAPSETQAGAEGT
jgi:hypothetical protein